MKKTISLLFLLCTLNVFSQKLITITSTPKEVPDGKKWVLITNQKILVEVSYGSLNSGTMCNANLYSNPRILTTIVEGEYGYPNQVYSILFKELEKVPYTNGFTYSIVPLSIVDDKFNFSSLSNTPVENVGKKQIVFYPGKKLYVTECLKSFQVVEYNLNQNELAVIKKKTLEKEKKEKALLYKPTGERLFNIFSCTSNGIDDWDNHGITGIKKIIISDSQNKFIMITENGVITKYGIREIENKENGTQIIGIGMLDQAKLTFYDSKVSFHLIFSHHKDMGFTYVDAYATMKTITKEQEDKEENGIVDEDGIKTNNDNNTETKTASKIKEEKPKQVNDKASTTTNNINNTNTVQYSKSCNELIYVTHLKNATPEDMYLYSTRTNTDKTKIVATLRENAKLSVIEESTVDEFYLVCFNGTEGYISKFFLEMK